MSLSEEVKNSRHKILWDSLRLGCEKVLEKNPHESGAKFTLQNMALMESIVGVGESLLKELDQKASQSNPEVSS